MRHPSNNVKTDLKRYMLSILPRPEITKKSWLASSATGMYASRSFSSDTCHGHEVPAISYQVIQTHLQQ